MFRFISWETYFICLAIVLVIYYFLLTAFCYRREMIQLIKGGTKHREEDQIEDNNIEDVEQMVHEVNGILEKAGGAADKSELLAQLKDRLANFAGLRQPAYRVALTNYIIRYAKQFCGVVFREEELEEAWEALLR